MGEQLRAKLEDIRKAEELRDLIADKLGKDIDHLLIIAGTELGEDLAVEHIENGREKELCALIFNTFNLYCKLYPETMNGYMLGAMMEATQQFNSKK